jgi:hypothetical protein
MKLNGSPMLLPYESWRIEQRNDFSEEFLPFDFAWGTLSFAVNETIDTAGVETIDPVQKSLLIDIAKQSDVSTVYSTEECPNGTNAEGRPPTGSAVHGGL